MLAAYDIRFRIKDKLTELGMSASKFAALVGLSDNHFSDFMNNKRSLGNEREGKLLETLVSLNAFKLAAHPFLLPLNDSKMLRGLLEHFERYEVTPEQVRTAVSSLWETKV